MSRHIGYGEHIGFQSFFHRSMNGYHRGNDFPAYIQNDGTQLWYLNGKLHRENNPAVIRSNGIVEWFQHGRPGILWKSNVKN